MAWRVRVLRRPQPALVSVLWVQIAGTSPALDTGEAEQVTPGRLSCSPEGCRAGGMRVADAVDGRWWGEGGFVVVVFACACVGLGLGLGLGLE